jgi:hypothetical protein
MSDQPGRESIEDDIASYSVDDEGQLQPSDTLDQDDVADELDRGYSPPEKPRGVDAFGTTVEEQRQGENLEQRIRQEEPDPNTAYGAPENESGLDEEEDRVGGDDPDSIAAEDDFIGDAEVGDMRAGRLVAPDEGAHEDVDHEMVGRDVGVNGAAASAEEAAMHIIDEE